MQLLELFGLRRETPCRRQSFLGLLGEAAQTFKILLRHCTLAHGGLLRANQKLAHIGVALALVRLRQNKGKLYRLFGKARAEFHRIVLMGGFHFRMDNFERLLDPAFVAKQHKDHPWRIEDRHHPAHQFDHKGRFAAVQVVDNDQHGLIEPFHQPPEVTSKTHKRIGFAQARGIGGVVDTVDHLCAALSAPN